MPYAAWDWPKGSRRPYEVERSGVRPNELLYINEFEEPINILYTLYVEYVDLDPDRVMLQ